ncbi:sensor histidine kinase [Bacillus sp. HMF5848]|uniref:PAS domain-containing sensor histidine kinase n=1 Tax=Bacillus sp. HMF5848 TaxID=2495421 RepID=UPI000F7A9DBA|nr:PAS domain-containing sensor histidine kinase [Bacillus sp. HMF5848]RSK26722.1 sensor histidine kinase [Bacillus sp. HMF5848]
MQMSKNGLKLFIMYIFVVFVPSLIISGYLIYAEKKEIQTEQALKVNTYTQFHKNHIDRLIGETIVSLETLTLLRTNDNNKIQTMLQKTYERDPRYAGLFYVNPKGDIVIGTKELKTPVSIVNQEFYLSAKIQKNTVISEAIDEIDDHRVVAILTPILNKNREITGYLLATLRLDYMKNVIRELTPDIHLLLVDGLNQSLLNTSNTKAEQYLVQVQLDKVPWRLYANPKKIDHSQLVKFSTLTLLITIAFSHVLFLLVKYILLKRQARRERHQNETQKMEMIGTLAASTAHEIRNPLTGIKGLIHLLQEKYSHEPEDTFYFSVINEEINRINQIVNEFLVLGKPTAEVFSKCNIVTIVKEVEPIIKSEANLYNAIVRFEYDSNDINVDCANVQIKQVILNLSKNALEAIEDTGNVAIFITAEEQNCIITVTDNGKGIPDHIMPNIFNPFVTQKTAGTGLGLVVCKRIVELHKGTIHVTSTVGVGTSVKITIPLA